MYHVTTHTDSQITSTKYLVKVRYMRFRSRQNGERNNNSNKGNYSLDCNCIEINFYSFIQLKKNKTKKAFDLVDHKCLLHKLEPYGVRGPGYNRFLDYLCNRTQRVKFGKELSSSLPLDYGVPQGSLLPDPFSSVLAVIQYQHVCLIPSYIPLARSQTAS